MDSQFDIKYLSTGDHIALTTRSMTSQDSDSESESTCIECAKDACCRNLIILIFSFFPDANTIVELAKGGGHGQRETNLPLFEIVDRVNLPSKLFSLKRWSCKTPWMRSPPLYSPFIGYQGDEGRRLRDEYFFVFFFVFFFLFPPLLNEAHP